MTQALKRDDVKIVNLDWLTESLRRKCKAGTTKYDWTKIDKGPMKKNKEVQKSSKKRKARHESYSDALLSHTEKFTGTSEASPEQDQEEESSKDVDAVRVEKKARQAFRRGAKAAKLDLISDNHHIYQDNTGFKYEVVVVKTELSKNWNERAVITLYESHSEPNTYACHFKSNGTLGNSSAAALQAVGANYPTAFSRFKAIFEEKTGIAWDDRFEKCPRRKAGRPAPAAHTNNSGFITPQMIIDAGGAGDPDVPPEGENLLREFKAKPFIYRTPPENEPQGTLPPHKMGFTNMTPEVMMPEIMAIDSTTQATAGAFDDFTPSQHNMTSEVILPEDMASELTAQTAVGAFDDHVPNQHTMSLEDIAKFSFEDLEIEAATQSQFDDQEMMTSAGSLFESLEMTTAIEPQSGNQESTRATDVQLGEQKSVITEAESEEQEVPIATTPQSEDHETMTARVSV